MKKYKSISYMIFICLIVISLAVLMSLLISLNNKRNIPQGPSISITPSIKPTEASRKIVGIYLIALGDNGKTGKAVGCGDSLVKVNMPTNSPSVQTAINELLAIKSTTNENGLYNALSLSSLSLDSIQQVGNTDIVNLTGKYFLGGVCDGPRLIEQIKATASQYGQGRSVSIMINGIQAERLFSGKGDVNQ